MFLYFLALLLNALIERRVRLAMREQAIRSLPLYPEERKCRYAATARILSLFSNQRRHVLHDGSEPIKRFADPLPEIQRKVLELLEVPSDGYRP